MDLELRNKFNSTNSTIIRLNDLLTNLHINSNIKILVHLYMPNDTEQVIDISNSYNILSLNYYISYIELNEDKLDIYIENKLSKRKCTQCSNYRCMDNKKVCITRNINKINNNSTPFIDIIMNEIASIDIASTCTRFTINYK